ncbi:MAG: response regulator [Planctomycetota bacterium]
MTDRILLVDDEAEFLEILTERLETRGVEVSTASDAAQALKAVEESDFDAIVLDLRMPGMDGLEALQAFRKKCPETQVILLTGHATVEKGVEAMKSGAMDVVEKPADIQVLLEKIKAASARKMVLVQKQDEARIRKILEERGW